MFPGCGFRLLLRRRVGDAQLLEVMGLDAPRPRAADDRALLRVVSFSALGEWTHVADAYGLWNDRPRRKAAIRALAALGDLFTFQLPDPDMGYAFAWYRDGLRERLRIVDSPRFTDQVLRVDEGRRLAGEPDDWRGEPFPMMVSIARGLGVPVDARVEERFYAWGPRT